MESQHSSSAPAIAETLRRQNRTRDHRDAHARLEFVMSDLAVRRLGQEIQEHEFHLGTLMSETHQAEAERWERALREGETDLFGQICSGKHGAHGRACLLDKDHDADGGPHWGKTADGRHIAWLGSAPDDD